MKKIKPLVISIICLLSACTTSKHGVHSVYKNTQTSQTGKDADGSENGGRNGNDNTKSVEENSITSGSKTKSLTTRTLANETDEEEAATDAEAENLVHEYQAQYRKNFIDWPVDSARMTRGYLPFKKKPHLGIDLAAPKGTAILAAHDGVVIYAGRDFRGFGKMVLIEGAYGWASIYAHFSKISVKTGEKVHQGQILGGMGRTGRATGVHLHFELRKKKGPVDPLLYLPAAEALVHKQASKPKFGKKASQNDI